MHIKHYCKHIFIEQKVVFICFLVVGLSSMISNLAHPITPTLFKNLDFNDYMFGVAYAAMSFTNFTFSPFWTKIMRKFGTGKMMSLCFLMYAITQIGFGLCSTEFSMIIVRMCSGISISGMNVGQIIYILNNSDEKNCANNLVICATLNTIMAAFGYMVGGFIGDYSIMVTIVVQVFSMFALSCFSFMLLKDKRLDNNLHSSETLKDSQRSATSKNELKLVVVIFLAICLFSQLSLTSYDQSFNYYIKDQYNFLPSYNGLLKAVIGIVSLIANMTICKLLIKKYNIVSSIKNIFLICLLLVMSIIFVNDIKLFVCLNIVLFGAMSVFQPLIQYLISKFNEIDSDILVGYYNSVKSIGMVIGSLISGFIYEIGPKVPFLFVAISYFVSIVLTNILVKNDI